MTDLSKWLNQVHCMDALELLAALPAGGVDCVVTSPPYYGLRDYGTDGQIGLEDTPAEYVAKLQHLFCEVMRVLRDDGVMFLNLGDSYFGSSMTGGTNSIEGSNKRKGRMFTRSLSTQRETTHDTPEYNLKPKDLIGIPWRVAFALQDSGWILRSDIIWHKPNPMPESVQDRPTKAHEYVFLFAKNARYYYDAESIAERAITGMDLGLLRGVSGVGENDRVAWHAPSIKKRQNNGVDSRTAGNGLRNKRSVWTVNTQAFSDAHFAVFPPKLIDPMIRAGCRPGGVVYDPFMGSGTTALVARSLGRQFIGSDISAEYVDMARARLALPFTLPMFP